MKKALHLIAWSPLGLWAIYSLSNAGFSDVFGLLNLVGGGYMLGAYIMITCIIIKE